MVEPEDGTIAERKCLLTKRDQDVDCSRIMNLSFRRRCANGSGSARDPISDPPGACHLSWFSRTCAFRSHNLQECRTARVCQDRVRAKPRRDCPNDCAAITGEPTAGNDRAFKADVGCRLGLFMT